MYKDLCRNNIFAHFKQPEIPLKLFVDIFVSFLKREIIFISFLKSEYNGFRFINGNSNQEKKEKVNR